MKINKLVQSISHFIESSSNFEHLKNETVSELTEYLQNVKINGIIFMNLPKDIQESSKIIQKYKPTHIADNEFLIVSNNPLGSQYCFITCDLSKAKRVLSNIMYPLEPETRLYGVTGTNGKTSIVNMTARICESLGEPVISMGTVGVTIGSKVLQAGSLNSTFPYIEILKVLYQNKSTSKVAFMELTSHALKQNRLEDLKFEKVFWTNFTQDHLDYHKTEADYFESKLKITDYSESLYVPEREKELRSRIERARPNLKVIPVAYKKLFQGEISDGFIKDNLSLAVKASEEILGRDLDESLGNYQQFLPEGRFEILNQNEKTFIVDYAHTPDALEKLLKEVNENFPNKQRVVVFGCGGNRDRSKRKLMGAIAQKNSDFVIATSDNPRNEEPLLIIEDIKEGFQDLERVSIEPDRRKAIELAVRMSKKENVIVVAGKGHEDYQEVQGVKYPFKDMEVIKEYL